MRCTPRGPPPRATIAGLMDLGGGVAFRVVSDDLDAIRDELAEHFHGLLGAQDAAGWRPHVTIQNKVHAKRGEGAAGRAGTAISVRGRLGSPALALHRYLGGPWETLARYPFRGR